MKNTLFWLVPLALALSAACGPGQAPGAKADTPAKQPYTFDLASYQLSKTAFHTDAHAAYLKDPLTFVELPDQGVVTEETAVVGSKVCRFYPGSFNQDTLNPDNLPEGLEVPFATILPVDKKAKIGAKDDEHGGMFHFQDNWNWFYPTTWKGQAGIVFGADLYGLNDTPEDNRLSALLYSSGGKFDQFRPVVGYNSLKPVIREHLTQNKLAFQAVAKPEYYLGSDSPDDMIALYMNHQDKWDQSYIKNRRSIPVFVTTDLLAHAQHLIFDRLLQYLEETYFTPRLAQLCQDFLDRLNRLTPATPAYSEAVAKARLYFQVPLALLNLAPKKVTKTDEYDRETQDWQDPDREAALGSFPEEVIQEIGLMDKHDGFHDSPALTFANGSKVKEDYSQYVPRGHYTKNGVLKAYFRAMMWLGRINFQLIADTDPDNIKLAEAMIPPAMLINDLMKHDEDLVKGWAALYDPITQLIGESDDSGYREVLPLWNTLGVVDFGAWVSNAANITTFRTGELTKLKPPAISGSSVFLAPGIGASREAPTGWRLFGQRFTLDSFVHQQVSPPRLMSRNWVRGLDVMKVLGSQTADILLANSDYPTMEGLKEKLDSLTKVFGDFDQDTWTKNYYNHVLYQVKAQAQFEPGAGFYFTESPAWGQKAMLSSHGTWAELRHDTILYVKQTYAERAGDGDYEPTFRTEKIPDPVHYLEPNIPFFQASVLGVQNLYQVLERFNLTDEETTNVLYRYKSLLEKGLTIAETEAKDEPVAEEDLKWIPTIAAELVHLVLIHNPGGSIQDEDLLKMALIADVYTNVDFGKVLEVGVGIPYRMYVPLNDKQGGKRIALGYTFSYYEFQHPMEDRLTDEKWKAEVYSGKDLSDRLPFWAEGLATPATGLQGGQ